MPIFRLIRKVTPNYPPLARQARIQGQVVLQAEISKDGTIQNLQLISGHPMLAPAAIEAALKLTAANKPSGGRNNDIGSGVIDARAALRGLGLAR